MIMTPFTIVKILLGQKNREDREEKMEEEEKKENEERMFSDRVFVYRESETF